jgi:hypothetical protein
LGLDLDGAAAETLDGRQDVVGGLGPTEGLLQFLGGPVGAALDLLFAQECEEALDLVDP